MSANITGEGKPENPEKTSGESLETASAQGLEALGDEGDAKDSRRGKGPDRRVSVVDRRPTPTGLERRRGGRAQPAAATSSSPPRKAR